VLRAAAEHRRPAVEQDTDPMKIRMEAGLPASIIAAECALIRPVESSGRKADVAVTSPT